MRKKNNCHGSKLQGFRIVVEKTKESEQDLQPKEHRGLELENLFADIDLKKE